jgi:signal transduction histidine kinase
MRWKRVEDEPKTFALKTDQIFNAFFTTKPQGSGMGLAISRSIIESHGGRLWASTNNGPGATFQLTLVLCKYSITN